MATPDLEYVLIPGMHRSGTSLLGHVIQDLGYSVGRSPMGADSHNLDGYYENVEIVKFHDEILERAHSSWSDVHRIPQEWWEQEVLEEFSEKLARLLDDEFGDDRRRLVKDPRMCRLLPLWLHHFASTNAGTVRFLLPIRSPWEVAHSLKARDGSSLPHGLFLWMQHVLSAEQATRGSNRLLIAHEDVMSGKVAPTLAHFLGLEAEKVEASILNLVKPSLRHQRHGRSSGNEAYPMEQLVAKSWTILSEACRGDGVDQTGLDSQWAFYSDLQQLIPAEFESRPTAITSVPRCSALFLDYGGGFTASLTVEIPMVLTDGAFHLKFPLPHSALPLQHLRWDPVEGEYARVSVFEVSTNAGNLSAIPANSHCHEDGMDVFYTVDPIYALEGDLKQVQSVNIKGRFELLPSHQPITRLSQEIATLQQECSALIGANATLQQERFTLIESNAAMLTENDRLCGESNKLVETNAAMLTKHDHLLCERNKLVKRFQKKLTTLKAQANTSRRAIEAWNHRSWFTRAFHRLRLNKRALGKSSNSNSTKRISSQTAVHRGQKAARSAVEILQEIRGKWVGRLAIRSLMLREVEGHLRKAEKALQRSRPEAALSLYEETVARSVSLLKLARKTPWGSLGVRSWRLQKAETNLEDIVRAKERWFQKKPPERKPEEKLVLSLFDADHYLSQNPDVAAAKAEPLEHYLLTGWREGRNPAPLFDVRWYLEQNPDVAAAGNEPLEHYLIGGWREGRNPHPQFDAAWYLRIYPDVAQAEVNPLLHFVRHGSREGRLPHPYFTPPSDSPVRIERVPVTDHPPQPPENLDGMTIILVTAYDFNHSSSIQVFSLANSMSDLGHRVHVCIPDGKETKQHPGNPRFHCCTYKEALNDPGRFESRSGERVMHVWTPCEEARKFTGQLRDVLDCPMVVHLEKYKEVRTSSISGRDRGLLPGEPKEKGGVSIPESLFHPQCYRSFLEEASGITFVMDFQSELIPADKPSLRFWPAHNREIFRATPLLMAERRRHGIEDHETVLAYAGDVTAVNRQEVASLYQAVLILRKEGFSVRLLRAGTNRLPLFDAEPDGVSAAVISLGQLPHTDIPRILGMADFFVQPGMSGADEDSCLPGRLPEFFSIGRPVLLPAANLGRYVRDGVDAVVLREGNATEIADRLNELIPDFQKREQLSLGALAFCREHFDWNKTAAALVEFYDQLPGTASTTIPYEGKSIEVGVHDYCAEPR